VAGDTTQGPRGPPLWCCKNGNGSWCTATNESLRTDSGECAVEQLREQGGQRRKFRRTQPTMGPVDSWDGLEVIQGVQVGHKAAWFGGGRARPAPAPAPLPPARASGWRTSGAWQVRRRMRSAHRQFPQIHMQVQATAAGVTCHAAVQGPASSCSGLTSLVN
jgi:hypothetical protein